jgi:cobalt-zinc-cadmium efflux system membrane fusion protein
VVGLSEEDITALKKGIYSAGVGRLSVNAPIAGTIIEKHAVVGELVEPGKDVMVLADLSNMWVWADIYEHDLSKLLQAEKDGPIAVKVYVRAFPGRPFRGKIDYIGATMTERTRTVKVRATIENPGFVLRQGMFCEINIGIGNGEEVLAVPRAALLSDEGNDFIFTHWKEDYYARRSVKRGREFFDSVEILEGLKDGETIIAEGAFLLKSDVLREKMGAGCAD